MATASLRGALSIEQLFRFGLDLTERVVLDEVGDAFVEGGKLIRAIVRGGISSGDAAENIGGFPQEPCGKLGMCHDVYSLLGPGFLFGSGA